MELVRDIYNGVDPDQMSRKEKKWHIETTLQDNPDVLFQLYTQDRLHMLFLRPTDPVAWLGGILIPIEIGLSFQMTKKLGVNSFYKIIMSGPSARLQSFCDDFEQLYHQVMENVADEEAAAAHVE